MRDCYVSDKSIVEEGASLGSGVMVWHFSHIRESAMIGKNTTIGSHCYIDVAVEIGEGCKIQSGCLIYTPAVIEDGVFIGPGVKIINDKNPRAIDANGVPITLKDWKCEGATIETGASIGAGSVIMPGITVGKFAIVGAGSIVTKDVLPN